MEALRHHLRDTGHADVRWLAFDATGGSVVDPSDRLPEWFEATSIGPTPGSGPLDVLDGSSHGAAVAAFERARRTGHGVSEVLIIGDDAPCRLHIFDVTDEIDCFLAVTAPTGVIADAADADRHVSVRQGSLGTTASGVIEWVSPELTALLGWTADELIGESTLELIHPDDHEHGILGWIEVLSEAGNSVTVRQRFKTADDEWRWCEATDRNMLDDPNWACVRADLVDISRELDAYAELERRETLLDRLSRSLPTAVLYVDVDGATLVSNARWRELTGRSPAEGLDGLRAAVADPDALAAALTAACDDDLDVDIEIQLARTDGRSGLCEFGHLHLRPLREHGRSIGMLATLDDTTEVRYHQRALAEQARRDPLTGLSNRLGMEEAIHARLLDPDRGLVIAFLDLDRFKSINDGAGHAAGDDFLRSLAAHLPGLLRPADVVARIGGDEFVAIIAGDSAARIANRFASGAVDVVARLVAERHPDLDVGVSVGLAEAEPGDSLDDLLRRADAAMYARKRAHRGVTGR